MRIKTSKLVASIAVIGAVAAGGAAFTAGIGVSGAQTVAGYGTTSVTGASINSLDYVQTDPAEIDSVLLTFTTDQSANVVKAAFNASGPLGITCTEVLPATDGLDYTCPTPGQSTATAEEFRVSVTN
jgi:hypothetical protein